MFFKRSAKSSDALSKDEKVEVLKTLENKSTRECERELIKPNPSIVPHNTKKIRDLTEDLIEVKVVLKREVMEKLSRVKELLSNKDPNINMAGLINILAESFLKHKDPLNLEVSKKINKQSPLTVGPQKPKTRHIPNTIKVIVFKRDNGRCQYVDSITNRKCNSSYQVEMDYKLPFSLGGSNSTENLRLLCKNHNIHSANKGFGVDLMKKYVPNLEEIST